MANASWWPPATVRYNNPGGMYPGPSADLFGSTGYETIGGGHKIAVFGDPESGAAAQFDLLANKYANLPLAQAIAKWSGGNSSPAYATKVARETGLSPDTILTRELLRDKTVAVPLARSMARWEAGQEFPLDESGWGRAHDRAFLGAPPSASSAPAVSPSPAQQGRPPMSAGLADIAEYQSPEEIALKRKMALQMLQQGTDTGPVGHPLAALARALQGGAAGYELGQANAAEKRLRQGQARALEDALGAFAPQSAPAASPAPPMPISPLVARPMEPMPQITAPSAATPQIAMGGLGGIGQGTAPASPAASSPTRWPDAAGTPFTSPSGAPSGPPVPQASTPQTVGHDAGTRSKMADYAALQAVVRNPNAPEAMKLKMIEEFRTRHFPTDTQRLEQRLTELKVKQAEDAIEMGKRQWGVIGHDTFGNPQYGFVDISKGAVQPYATASGPSAAMGNLSGEEFLKTLDKPIADQVRALSEGRMAFPAGFAMKSPYWQRMVTMVGQYDPTFDAVNFNARNKARADFTSGKSAQNITSFNTVLQHLNSLYDAAEGLNNSDIPYVNKMINYVGGNLSAEKQASLKRFQAAKTAVTEELTRAFRGSGGNVHDIQEWQKAIDAADSPAALKASISQAVELLNGRLEAVADQYNRGMGTTKQPIELLSPKAQTTVARLAGKTGEKATVSPHGTPVRVNSIDEALQLEPGTVFITPDGRTKVRP